jgi:hypothetical protein
VTKKSVAVLAALPAMLSLAVFAYLRVDVRPLTQPRANLGFAHACNAGAQFRPLPECRNRQQPSVMVWGDSFGMYLIDAAAPGGVIQATKTFCGPFLGIAPIDDVQYRRTWAQDCLRFNDSVVDYLTAHKEIETIVLSSALGQYIPGAEAASRRLLQRDASGETIAAQDSAALLDSLRRTVAALRARNKKVVFVAPPPAPHFDISRCLARLNQRKPFVAAHMDCAYPETEQRAQSAPLQTFLETVARDGFVSVLRFETLLCPKGICRASLEGTPLYIEGGHFSPAASALLGKNFDFATRIKAEAR